MSKSKGSLSSLLAKFKKGDLKKSAPAAANEAKGQSQDNEKNDALIAALLKFQSNQWSSLSFKRHSTDRTQSSQGGADSTFLCFIIIDKLPHELIWRTWLQQGGTELQNRVKICIHAKYPRDVDSDWVRERLVPFNLHPGWGSIDLTAVMLKLVEYALQQDKDAAVAKFCFMSESCVPIAALDRTLDGVLADECSWVNYASKQNDGYAWQKQFVPLLNVLPPACVLKADQWVLLNRHDAVLLVEAPKMLETTLTEHMYPVNPNDVASVLRTLFKKVSVTDEMYVASILALCGVLQPQFISNDSDEAEERKSTAVTSSGGVAANTEPCLEEGADPENDAITATPVVTEVHRVVKKRLTYCDWSKKERSPQTYTELTNALVTTARQEGCFFLRKLKLPDSNNPGEKRKFSSMNENHQRSKIDMLSTWLSTVLGMESESPEHLQYLSQAVEILNPPRPKIEKVGEEEKEEENKQGYSKVVIIEEVRESGSATDK